MQSSYNDIKNISPFTLPFAHSERTGLPLCLGNLFIMQLEIDFSKEFWKDIKGFEGKYMVSNLGRIYSFKSKKLIIGMDNSNGYRNVLLSNGCIKHRDYIHRIVATTFIPNPENKPQVNHLDGDKSNNRVCNLEWCTNKENRDHAVKNKLHGWAEQKGVNNSNYKDGKHIIINQEKICITCGKSYVAKYSYRKFCSVKCIRKQKIKAEMQNFR